MLLGRYLVIRELNCAALGPVHLARDLWLNRNVTLKVMKPLWARNAPFVARFTREAYAAALLAHTQPGSDPYFGEDKGAHLLSPPSLSTARTWAN